MADPTGAGNGTCSGAAWILRALQDEGVDTIFGYPGGAIMPFYDALVDTPVRHILARHEQGAAFAANGYARASARLGVCVATSGPGASNLVTGIADAMADSVPLLAITGNVASGLLGTDAFQELDIFGLTLPIVKHSYALRDAASAYALTREACRIARSGRPGPVLIDVPKDVQTALAVAVAEPGDGRWQPRTTAIDEHALAQARALLAQAQRPLVYAGGGVEIAGAEHALRALVETLQVPVVLTLRGLGALPADHPLLLGMLGMHGSQPANFAVQEADLLLVVGARFDDRATGKLAAFAPHARVIHLDADAAEFGKLRQPDVSLDAPLVEVLPRLGSAALAVTPWRQRCRSWQARHAVRYGAPTPAVHAPTLLHRLSRRAPADAIVCCDVGQHQMWVAQHYGFGRTRCHLTSGGLGAMGFGLPAAIGAQIAFPQRTVINVSGDGSFMMNVQELATIHRYRLPIKIVLLDNQALGMVRQWQELFFDRRFSEIDLSDNPDFAALAEVFRLRSLRLERDADMESAIGELLAEPGPVLLHVRIDRDSKVWPLVPPNRHNAQMMEAHDVAHPDHDAP